MASVEVNIELLEEVSEQKLYFLLEFLDLCGGYIDSLSIKYSISAQEKKNSKSEESAKSPSVGSGAYISLSCLIYRIRNGQLV